ncbi:MAG: alpha/beta fold hydrolase [Crocinitomicaceae bacterium]
MKQKLLLLHGALGTKDQFKVLETKLSPEFNVLSFDFEGHGGQQSNNDFSMSLFVGNVVDFLKKNKIDSVHVFGYSMGGYVALCLASKHPHLVKRIITLGTKFDWTRATAEKEVKMLNPNSIEEKVPRFASHLETIHGKNWKKMVVKTANMMLGLGEEAYLSKNELGGVSHEILIGVGSNDSMVSIEESEACTDALPNGNLEIIEEFEHSIEKVDSLVLSTLISNFIKVN